MTPHSGEGGFAQVGSGSTVLTLPNTYIGPTTINAGTLTLGASGVIPDASAVAIGNGTLNAGTFSETAATLEITGTATINFGTGAALVFADSSSIAWSGGTLDLTGSFVSGTSLRFGTSAGGLTASQLALISINGSAVPLELNANGYLIQAASGYASWKAIHAPITGDDPSADEDGDTVTNGIEYLLGGTATTNDLDKLPKGSTDGTNIIFSFERDQESIDGNATVAIEISDNLSEWPATYLVPAGAVANNPGVTVIKNTPAGFDTVTLTLPMSAETRRFVRIKMNP